MTDGPPPDIEPVAPFYPLTGLLFSGSAEALEQARAWAAKHSIKMEPRAAANGQPALWAVGDSALRNAEAMLQLLNEARSGAFGDLSIGFLSEP